MYVCENVSVCVCVCVNVHEDIHDVSADWLALETSQRRDRQLQSEELCKIGQSTHPLT